MRFLLALLSMFSVACGKADRTAESETAASACANDAEPCSGACNSSGYCEQDHGWGPEVRVPAATYVVYVRTGRLAMGKAEPAVVTFPAPYWIAKRELTIGRARECTSCGLVVEGTDDMPLQVTRAQAEAVCAAGGGRLPTNYEWEAAGRGPTTCNDPNLIRANSMKCNERYFPWGNDDESFCDRALIRDCKPAGPRAVGDQQAGESPLGVQEMIGNVNEWISDMEDDEGLVKGGDWDLIGEEWSYAMVTLIARERAKVDSLHGVRCVRGPVMDVEPRIRGSRR